ncbi:hypothetical protein [Pseudomonas coleopterorum]|uniref:Uncharacterized protein n=1 Tax=Pseudomonas coleopterorum TaxID=1605838 RepID=A0AAJ6M2B0_9PSED|nr:hypothetical protein [Pseudomonas coleopterorum]WNC11689.1 hypothetical protein RI108_09885 [Pseudomonas coleopterorum]
MNSMTNPRSASIASMRVRDTVWVEAVENEAGRGGEGAASAMGGHPKINRDANVTI